MARAYAKEIYEGNRTIESVRPERLKVDVIRILKEEYGMEI